MEIALMEGGHSLEKPTGKMEFIKSLSNNMKATEILSERFDYSGYIPALQKTIYDTFYQVKATEGTGQEKVAQFAQALQAAVSAQVVDPIAKAGNMVYNGTPITSIQFTIEPVFKGAVGKINVGSTSAKVQRSVKADYPYIEMPRAGIPTIAQYVKGNVHLIGKAYFQVHPKQQSAEIAMDIDGTNVANYMFLMDDQIAGEIVQSALSTFTNKFIGQLFHEIKHYMQLGKIAQKPHLDASKEYDRYYTGNPKTMDRAKHYKNKSGYWLNSAELDSWAANVASEIVNIFGTDTQAMVAYLNAAGKGQTTIHQGLPVKTHLATYYNHIFNPRYKVNTPRQDIWRKFVKNVYKDIQLYINK
jgi:hypothetical protein